MEGCKKSGACSAPRTIYPDGPPTSTQVKLLRGNSVVFSSVFQMHMDNILSLMSSMRSRQCRSCSGNSSSFGRRFLFLANIYPTHTPNSKH